MTTPICKWCEKPHIVYKNELTDPDCRCESIREYCLYPLLEDMTDRMRTAMWERIPEPILETVNKILKQLSDGGDIQGLWIRSGVGTGKTMAFGLVAQKIALEHEKTARYVNVVQLFRRMTEDINLSDEVLAPYLYCDLLLLDDLGKEYSTSWKNEVLYYLIDSRYQANRPMWIATNIDGKELAKRCGPAIVDRISEVCVPLVFDARSMRVPAKP